MPHETESVATTLSPSGHQYGMSDAGRSITLAFLLHLGGALHYGSSRCFYPESSATYVWGSPSSESSTQFPIPAPDVVTRLNSILSAATSESLEDGMRNSITERLPALLTADASTVIPALVSVLESGRANPVVVGEVLKELGNLRSIGRRSDILWILERALALDSHYLRDAAGLGLARFGDASAVPHLQRAVEREPSPELRRDLQLVLNELVEARSHGAPPASSL